MIAGGRSIRLRGSPSCVRSRISAPEIAVFIPCRRARNRSGAGMAPTLLACRVAGDIGGERGGRHRQQRVSTDPQSAPVDAFAGDFGGDRPLMNLTEIDCRNIHAGC